MFKKFVLGQVRHALSGGGGSLTTWLIANGATVNDAEVIISGAVTLLAFAWSFWDKWKEEKKVRELNE